MVPLGLLAALCLLAAPERYDLVLENARVVDGTGAPWFRADVGVRGDRIAAVGDLHGAPAGQRIDVHDHVVAPGFIDLLGQSELTLLVDPRGESKIRQGVTSELTGEGVSVAPMTPALAAEARDWLTLHHLGVDWTDLSGYWRRFRAARPAMNLGTTVGAAQVRAAVMGLGEGAPTPDQLLRMQVEVRKAMRQGAFGLSSALIYPPGSYARTEELVALAQAAAPWGGSYFTHIRDEGDDVLGALEEAITIGRRARIPVEIWHLKVAGRRNWGRMGEVVRRIEAARAEGVDIAANVYPYLAGANNLTADLPGWAMAGGTEAMLERLRNPDQRSLIEVEIASGWPDADMPERITVAATFLPEAKAAEGKTVAQLARERHLTPAAAVVDLALADRGTTQVLRFWADEPDLRLALRQRWTAIGIDANSDAVDGPLAQDGNHPRAFGSMPRVLGTYAREAQLFPLEEAVRKMTSLPAARLGLGDRGLVRPGMAADLVVFDPATVSGTATYAHPKQYPVGIELVVVNGQVVLQDGIRTDARPGRPLLHPVPPALR
ncbi:MAG TPA: D-aminoacylase [Myxococcaceae bacterium]|jgi:dihydroorotase/N-acyl-D-amino-acid deacylase|nr:D-aminoacylase [Myxococcaceae bacterium]